MPRILLSLEENTVIILRRFGAPQLITTAGGRCHGYTYSYDGDPGTTYCFELLCWKQYWMGHQGNEDCLGMNAILN